MRAIETRSLARQFGGITAVDSLDLNVREGEIYGFLGPNSAGKLTTINMLLGFTPPSSGSGTVLGHDIENGTVSTLEALDGVSDVSVDETAISATLSDSTRKAPVVNAIEETGAVVMDIASEEPSLEDLFAAFTASDRSSTDRTATREVADAAAEAES